MQTVTEKNLSSSVLVVGPPPQESLSLGVDWIPPSSKALSQFEKGRYDVLVSSLDFLMQEKNLECLARTKKLRPFFQLVVVQPLFQDMTKLVTLRQKLTISHVVSSFEKKELESSILTSLERAQTLEQELELASLIQDQNQKLKLLYNDLEERVVKRQKFLEESRRKTSIANLRWQTLREAMIAIHKALSVGEMEQGLAEVLASPLHLSSVRIFFQPQDQHFAQQTKTSASFSQFQAPLFRFQQPMGSVFFLREGGRPFHKEESDFLLRVSEALSLSLDRLSHLRQSETLREQWQATFNAITDPVVLINRDYEVIQANSSAMVRSQQTTTTGTKCYQMLFHRDSPCTHCQLGTSSGKNFRLESRLEILDVSSQSFDGLHFNIYHDISDQVRMERKILETARMAELGTIGSSIAHELNNPLGGILSFVQLIKMDLKPEDAIYADLEEMEKGVKRCRDIIENLLGFTRNPDVDEIAELDLKEVILRALKIVELQTKTKNIEIKTLFPQEAAKYRGHFNMLSQAFKNIFQLSIDSLLERGPTNAGSPAIIEISLEAKENEYLIQILDNGPGQGRRNSLQYSISSQIAHEHGGILEITGLPRQMTMAKFSFPRLDS
jgi:signal transduction histidine kinase